MPAAAPGLLKRQLGLVRPSTHGANAAWWRVRSRVKIDDWSARSGVAGARAVGPALAEHRCI